MSSLEVFRGFGPRFLRLSDYVDSLENELFRSMDTAIPAVRTDGLTVHTDISESKNEYKVVADLPGLSKENIKIDVSPDRVLSISGERMTEQKEEGSSWYRNERRFGSFFRSFRLPVDADMDNIKAKSENGELVISIPKKERVEGGRVITIN